MVGLGRRVNVVDEVGELNVEVWWEVDAADEADGLSSSICLIFCSILRRRWLSEVSLARAFCILVVTFFCNDGGYYFCTDRAFFVQ